MKQDRYDETICSHMFVHQAWATKWPCNAIITGVAGCFTKLFILHRHTDRDIEDASQMMLLDHQYEATVRLFPLTHAEKI
jgi:hypothetical protein